MRRGLVALASAAVRPGRSCLNCEWLSIVSVACAPFRRLLRSDEVLGKLASSALVLDSGGRFATARGSDQSLGPFEAWSSERTYDSDIEERLRLCIARHASKAAIAGPSNPLARRRLTCDACLDALHP